jgi:hypothetical protein
LHSFIKAQLMVASSDAASNKMLQSAKETRRLIGHVILRVLKEPTKDSAHWNGRLILPAAAYGACEGAQR